MSNYTTGPLTASAEEVAELLREVILETTGGGRGEELARKAADVARIRKHLIDRTWFEARQGGRLVGVANVHMTDQETAYLAGHYVSVRGIGIGSALTVARLEWARNQGAKTAVATTHHWSQASMANLAKHGFVISGESPDGWLPGETIVELKLVL